MLERFSAAPPGQDHASAHHGVAAGNRFVLQAPRVRVAVLETFQLTKRYGGLSAVADCTLAVPPGEIFGLLGPNGAGKTTLLRLLMGYLRPSAGSARILGMDCWRQSRDIHQAVSYLPGDVRLFRRMRGDEVLRLLCRLRGQRDPAPALRLAERLQLDLSRRVARCSTGMRQKLALAAVLSAEVPLVILDEPTSNLDPTMRDEVLRLLKERRSAGATIVCSSHVLSEMEALCDRVAILRGGRLVHMQPMRQLRHAHRIHARLAGPMPQTPLPQEVQMRLFPAEARLEIETADGLAPLLGWLAQLPLAEVRIEALGLETVYRRYHPARQP